MTIIRLAAQPGDDEILRAVETWLDALVEQDFDRAFDLTEHDHTHGWSPDLIRRVIRGYGLPAPPEEGRADAVTPRHLASGSPAHRDVDRDPGGRGALANVWYSLPLDGKWSDLTATFRVEAREAGTVLVLEEIHVF